VSFTLPFRRFEEKTIEDTVDYSIRSDGTGRQLKYNKKIGLELFFNT